MSDQVNALKALNRCKSLEFGEAYEKTAIEFVTALTKLYLDDTTELIIHRRSNTKSLDSLNVSNWQSSSCSSRTLYSNKQEEKLPTVEL